MRDSEFTPSQLISLTNTVRIMLEEERTSLLAQTREIAALLEQESAHRNRTLATTKLISTNDVGRLVAALGESLRLLQIEVKVEKEKEAGGGGSPTRGERDADVITAREGGPRNFWSGIGEKTKKLRALVQHFRKTGEGNNVDEKNPISRSPFSREDCRKNETTKDAEFDASKHGGIDPELANLFFS